MMRACALAVRIVETVLRLAGQCAVEAHALISPAAFHEVISLVRASRVMVIAAVRIVETINRRSGGQPALTRLSLSERFAV